MNRKYQLPSNIPFDMGGIDAILDERLTNVIELLGEAPISTLSTFLDIGMGKGQLLKWLSKKGKSCTGTSIEISSYGVNVTELKNDYGINIVVCNAENMPLKNQSFDAVVLSHVLEHCLNVGLVLNEVRRILSDKGWLFLFVPPYKNMVSAGHVATGWNIGQLMYVLCIAGYDVKNGRFIKYGYNICAFVKKNLTPLPPLRGDRGDISILQRDGFFPLPIVTKDGFNDCFYGDVLSINWDSSSIILKKLYNTKIESSKLKKAGKRILTFVFKFLPNKIKYKLSDGLISLGSILKNNPLNNSNNLINPKILKG